MKKKITSTCSYSEEKKDKSNKIQEQIKNPMEEIFQKKRKPT